MCTFVHIIVVSGRGVLPRRAQIKTFLGQTTSENLAVIIPTGRRSGGYVPIY